MVRSSKADTFVTEPRNTHAQVRPIRSAPSARPRPVLYDQDSGARRNTDGVILTGAQAAAIAGVLADVLARNGSPHIRQIREAIRLLTPHPSTQGPRNGGAA